MHTVTSKEEEEEEEEEEGGERIVLNDPLFWIVFPKTTHFSFFLQQALLGDCGWENWVRGELAIQRKEGRKAPLIGLSLSLSSKKSRMRRRWKKRCQVFASRARFVKRKKELCISIAVWLLCS